MIRIWFDDKQAPPETPYKYIWCKSLSEVELVFEYSDKYIKRFMDAGNKAFFEQDYACKEKCYRYATDYDIECVDVEYGHAKPGAKYNSLLAWLKRNDKKYVRVWLHSSNKEE